MGLPFLPSSTSDFTKHYSSIPSCTRFKCTRTVWYDYLMFVLTSKHKQNLRKGVTSTKIYTYISSTSDFNKHCHWTFARQTVRAYKLKPKQTKRLMCYIHVLCIYVCIYIYICFIYIYTYLSLYIYIHIYTYIYREREMCI